MDNEITPEENFTTLFLGELENSDLSINQILEETPEMQGELDCLSNMVGLLSESLENEWRAQDITFDDQSDVTSYALNELDDSKLSEFESKMQKSPALQQEVQAVRAFTAPMARQFEVEWMQQYPVETDQLCLTDLVAGELTGFEAAHAEALVNSSSLVQKETDSTQEMMELLSASLTDEWQSALKPESNFSIVENDVEFDSAEPLIEHDFSTPQETQQQRRRSRSPLFLAAAAAVTGLVAVGTIFNPGNQTAKVAATGSISEIPVADQTNNNVWKYTSTTAVGDNKESNFKVPTLLLVDEVADSLESFETTELDDSSSFGNIQTVSFNDDSLDLMPSNFSNSNDFSPSSQFDPSFPPVEKGRVTYSVQNQGGNRSILMSDSRKHTNGLQSVYVQGLFTIPEGSEFDVNTVFEPKKVDAIYKELENVRLELEEAIKSLDADRVDIPELKRKLSTSLEHYRELGNQLHSK